MIEKKEKPSEAESTTAQPRRHSPAALSVLSVKA